MLVTDIHDTAERTSPVTAALRLHVSPPRAALSIVLLAQAAFLALVGRTSFFYADDYTNAIVARESGLTWRYLTRRGRSRIRVGRARAGWRSPPAGREDILSIDIPFESALDTDYHFLRVRYRVTTPSELGVAISTGGHRFPATTGNLPLDPAHDTLLVPLRRASFDGIRIDTPPFHSLCFSTVEIGRPATTGPPDREP